MTEGFNILMQPLMLHMAEKQISSPFIFFFLGGVSLYLHFQ